MTTSNRSPTSVICSGSVETIRLYSGILGGPRASSVNAADALRPAG